MKIDKRKAKALLTEVVKEAGAGHVTSGNGCVYVQGGKPSCIVGRVVAKASDVDPMDIFSGNNRRGFNLNSCRFEQAHGEIAAQSGLTFTPGAIDILINAQDHQDVQMPWGQVLDNLDKPRL